jgi:hypothetical protein
MRLVGCLVGWYTTGAELRDLRVICLLLWWLVTGLTNNRLYLDDNKSVEVMLPILGIC